MESQEVEECGGGGKNAADARCDFGSCEEPAAVDFDAHSLCAAHFVSESIRELDARAEGLKGLEYEASATSGFRDFLESCERQAKTLAEGDSGDDGQSRSRAQQVLQRVSQVSQKLRRSPRFGASVPVWLRREDPGKTWEEQTWTSSVSRHGAGFSCNRPVDVGGEVVLCRRDRGNRVRARVVYCRYDKDGRREIGVELVDQDDFWELDKQAQASTPVNSQKAPN